MSLTIIIIGLLIWFAVPAFFKKRVGDSVFSGLSMVCRVVGIVVIAVGILKGIF